MSRKGKTSDAAAPSWWVISSVCGPPMSYISALSLAHEVILKRLKRLGDLVPPGALEARSGIRGLSLATLDSFELSVSPVRPTVRTISRLGGRRQLAALLEPQTRRRQLGPRRVVGTTGLGGVVIRGLGSVGSPQQRRLPGVEAPGVAFAPVACPPPLARAPPLPSFPTRGRAPDRVCVYAHRGGGTCTSCSTTPCSACTSRSALARYSRRRP